jgi:hypothetical protein
LKDDPPEISRENRIFTLENTRLAGQITVVEHSVTDGDECAGHLDASGGGVNRLMAEILGDVARYASGSREGIGRRIDRGSGLRSRIRLIARTLPLAGQYSSIWYVAPDYSQH